MREPTILINLRIPKSILKKFDEVVAKDNLSVSRTAKVIVMMNVEIKKQERKDKKRKRVT